VPTWLEILLLAVLGLLLLLTLGGVAGAARRRRGREGSFGERLREANAALAHARAGDRGWERAGLETAARAAFASERPGVEVVELALVQVVDRPGVDEDQAVFRVLVPGAEHWLTLGRSGGTWQLERLT
jgi:hypothetical protein